MEVGVSKSAAPHRNRGENSPCSIRLCGIPPLGHTPAHFVLPHLLRPPQLCLSVQGLVFNLLLQDSAHAGPCIAFPHAPLGLTLLPLLRCWMPRPLTTDNQSQLLSSIPKQHGPRLVVTEGLTGPAAQPTESGQTQPHCDQFLFCFSLFPRDRVSTV